MGGIFEAGDWTDGEGEADNEVQKQKGTGVP